MRSRLLLGASLAAGLLFTASAAAAQAPAPAPDARKAAVIRQLLEETHAADQMIAVVETNLPAQRAAMPGIPAVFWDRFIAGVRAQRGELLDAIVPIYARAFDLAELEQLLAFYKTPLGQRLIVLQPSLLRDSTQVGQLWGARIGQAVGEQLAKEGVQIQQLK
jgi:uncharacterized protein